MAEQLVSTGQEVERRLVRTTLIQKGELRVRPRNRRRHCSTSCPVLTSCSAIDPSELLTCQYQIGMNGI